jgi:NADPH-dependent 2,4-dienoyl-CoA reductase/sulfur reductase-like enzyme
VSVVLPVQHQPPLPASMIRRDQPGPEAIELDVLIVGAGPAGLACAIEFHR